MMKILNRMSRHLLIIGYLLLTLNLVFAQSARTIRGEVRFENGTPATNVTVKVKDGTQTVVTDERGVYEIQAGESAILLFSLVGFRTQEVSVVARTTVNVAMQDQDALQEVVVVGYGTQKKVNLSGAVSQIGSDELVDRPVANLTGALQGTLPGVAVTRGSGKPGSEGYGIRIRGFSSANAMSALVLVDGIQMDLNLINPEDVESISVLKDASASAIYGARAAGGVILVTTKKGKQGKPVINYNNYYGVNVAARRPERLNSWDEQILINESRLNATGNPEFTEEQIEWLKNPNFSVRPNPTQDRWEYFGNNNWVTEGMNKYSGMHNHNVSVSGGGEKTVYNISTGYYHRDGVLRYGPDDNSRYTLRTNLSTEVNKYINLDISANYVGSEVNENAYGTDQIINRLYRSRTRQSLYVPEEDVTGQPYNGDLQINAVDIQKNGGEWRRLYGSFTGRANLKIKDLLKGLTVDLSGSRNQDYFSSVRNRRTLMWYGRSTNTTRFSIHNPNSTENTKNRGYLNNLQAVATYNFDVLDDHHFTLLGGTSYEEYRKDELTAGAQSMITNDFFSLNYGDPLTKTNGDLVETWAIASYFGRLNYNFQEKYLFEASVRYDGSSRLAPENRWKLFPSFSAAWRLDQEDFLRDNGIFDQLKLRGSWGQLGNGSSLGFYDYIPLLTSGLNVPTSEEDRLVFNNLRTQFLYQRELASAQKTWEVVEQSNVGLDMTFLENRLSFTGDYYVKRNKNMLATLNLPSIIGINVPRFNVGELKSWGWEFDLKWRDKVNDFSYSIGLNLSDNQNELVKFDGRNIINEGHVELLEGYPMNTVWGYRTDGYFQTQEEYDQYKQTVSTPFFPNNAGAGDVKYLDLNGDGVITAGGGTPEEPGDLINYGTTNGRYFYGLNLDFQWKGFDASIFFQGVAKRVFLINEGTLSPMLGTADLPWTIHMDRWTPDNPDAFFPRMYQTSAHNYRPSDRYIQNGAYVRLKNLQLGYTVPLRTPAIQKLRVFFSGQDLWEYTDVLNVFDPEVPNNVSATTYPFFRSISFGLNVTF